MSTIVELRNRLTEERLYLEQLEQQLAVARINGREDRVRFFENEIAKQQAVVNQIQSQLDRALQTETLSRQSAGVTVRDDQLAREDKASVISPLTSDLVLDAAGRVVSPSNNIPSNATTISIRSAFESAVDEALGNTGIPANPRRLQDLMSTPASPAADPPPPYAAGPRASENRGEAAAGDDNTVRSTLNQLFGSQPGSIVAQSNALSKYASYTYSISIYIMSPSQYNTLLQSKKKNIPGWQLLIQSGGIAPAPGAPTESIDGNSGAGAGQNIQGQTQFTTGRNQFFPLDFYIDDVNLRALVPGKGSGGAHGLVSLNFKIQEPNGLTFINRLRDAAEQYVGSGAPGVPANYAAQNYLMVIRFYGYDQFGNLVGPVKGPLDDGRGNATDAEAVIEKFIPFMFTGIKFRLSNRMVEYDCSAVCPQYSINASRGRGVIPYNVEITARTLKDLFSGNLEYSANSPNADGRETRVSEAFLAGPDQSAAETNRLTAQNAAAATSGWTQANISAYNRAQKANAAGEVMSQARRAQLGIETPVVAGNSPTQATAPPKANAAPTPTITQGIAAALNQYQDYLVNVKKEYTVADQYEIEVLPPLDTSQVVPLGITNYKSKGWSANPNTSPANQQKNPSVGQVPKDTKITSVLAGMSVVQFLDQYTRQSTYIYDQQLAYIDDRGQKIPNPAASNQVLGWYRIGMEASPIKYDPKRNDYAYRIKYQVAPYKITNLQSDWFPESPFTGVQKKYNYWFTGINTEVLDLSIDYNTMYYLVISGQNELLLSRGANTNYREAYKKIYQPNSAQSSFGISGNVNEPSANAADYLYSPSDVAKINMSIVGDPAWIPQGEVWSGLSGFGGFNPDPFLADGTINFDSQEVLFEVLFNVPVDYDLQSGIQDPGQNNYGADRQFGIPGEASQTYVYRAIECTSTFAKGRFTQNLQGTIVLFDPVNAQQAEAARTVDDARPTTTPAVDTQSRTGALGSADGVDFAGSEFGAYFGSGETGGAVNYQPRGLSTVLDSQRTQNPLTADSLAAEGFDNQALGLAEVNPPTSSGQPVGVESLSTVLVQQTPGAGVPIGTLPTDNDLQRELWEVGQQIAEANQQGNREELVRLLELQRRLQDRLTGNPFFRATTQTNQTVKER